MMQGEKNIKLWLPMLQSYKSIKLQDIYWLKDACV